MHPLDLAIFWIEYVLEHKDCSHLRLANKHLNFFQLYGIDIVAAIAFVWAGFLYLICRNVSWRRNDEAQILVDREADKIKND